MSIEAAVRTRLLATAGVATLVGARVYPVKLPQQAAGATWLPAVTCTVVSELRQNSFRGPIALPGTLFAIDCWGETYTSARALATQVRLALDGWQGTSEGETVQASILEGQQDIFESEVNVHRTSLDVRLFWNENQS